jgi:hypothetical protein
MIDRSSLLAFVGSTTSSHGFVARWYDQSGNNLHFIQPTTSAQPSIVRSGSLETYSILSGSVKTYETYKPGLRFNANVNSLMYINNTMSFSYIHNSNSTIYTSYQPNITESISNRRMNIIDSATGSYPGNARGVAFWWDDRPQFGTGSSVTINLNGPGISTAERPITFGTGSRLPGGTPLTRSLSSVYNPFKVGYNQSIAYRISPTLSGSNRFSQYVDNVSYENIISTTSGSLWTSSVATNPMTLGGNFNSTFAQVDGYIDEVIFYPYNMSSSREFMNYMNKYRQNY